VQGNEIIWLALILPLFGAILQTFLAKRVSKKVLGVLAVLPIALAFCIGVVVSKNLDPSSYSVISSIPWIEIKGLSIPFELRIDTLSMTMVLVITGIGALIHLYATGYMSEERDYARFFAYLNLFIAAMLILVLGNNLLLLFVGWEGVGLCSYLLIGFWYQDISNSKAANKAFIVNRIGDWGLTLGLLLIIATVATANINYGPKDARLLSYDTILPVLEQACKVNPGLATAIALLLFVGACGKSAQFPLYLWLPDAMAGPTPVSALIHAATMVTSGVVLLNRMHVVFELSPIASIVVCVVGAFTALFAAVIAFGQTDIKKVLAYSTVSQLGFMFVACGAGAYWIGLFHVITHAFFKALLFLGSGAVIHSMSHEQDMRNYGNLRKYVPITFFTMMAGYLAISGVPLLSGAISKEKIIGAAIETELAMTSRFNAGQFAGYICLFTAMLTAMYMTRMMWLTFFGGKERWRDIKASEHDSDHDDHHALNSNHVPREVPISMWSPLVVLALLSLGGGYFLNEGDRLKNWLYASSIGQKGTLPLAESSEDLIHLLEQVSIGAAIGGIVLGLFFYWKGLPKREGWDLAQWSPIRRLAGNQFGYDAAMVGASVDGGRELATILDENVDKGLIGGSVNGLYKVSEGFFTLLNRLQSGLVRMYALSMLVGMIGIALVVLYFSHGGGR
jgi:NADH-quinone oxidoreductase subunit L